MPYSTLLQYFKVIDRTERYLEKMDRYRDDDAIKYLKYLRLYQKNMEIQTNYLQLLFSVASDDEFMTFIHTENLDFYSD